MATGLLSARVEPAACYAWFQKTYPAAVTHGEAVYDRLSMRATCVDYGCPGDGNVITALFSAFDGCYRLEILQDDTGQFADVYIMTPDDSVIFRRKLESRYVHARRLAVRNYEPLLFRIRSSFPLPFAPWFAGEHRIRDMLEGEKVELVNVSLANEPDVGCVCSVEWQICFGPRATPWGQYRFAVDRGWVLLSRVEMSHPKDGLAVTLVYGDEEIDGVPIIRRTNLVMFAEGLNTRERQFDREWFDVIEDPGDMFDSTKYRISAALLPEVARRRRLWNSLIPTMLGVVLVLACLQGWRMQHSSQERRATVDGAQLAENARGTAEESQPSSIKDHGENES